MANVFLTGASGRLGSVIAETMSARGDVLVPKGEDVNYMIFAHRYRGVPSFDKEMTANVDFIRHCVQEAFWAIGDCAIVIASSISSIEPALNQSLAYNLSKACNDHMARYYAKALGVRCNTVNPDSFTSPESKLSAQEVANVIEFLCSPKASGINGQNIRISK